MTDYCALAQKSAIVNHGANEVVAKNVFSRKNSRVISTFSFVIYNIFFVVVVIYFSLDGFITFGLVRLGFGLVGNGVTITFCADNAFQYFSCLWLTLELSASYEVVRK